MSDKETRSTDDEFSARLDKRERLESSGGTPYGVRFEKTHSANDVNTLSGEGKLRSADDVVANPEITVRSAGRVTAVREHGKITFINVQDQTGEVQVCVREDVIGEKHYAFFLEYIDLGDFVGIAGEPFLTKQEKLAVLAVELVLLSKALRPIPTKHFGLEDVELRYRKRYLDMIANPDTKERFLKRAKIIQTLRNWLLEHNFVELTTRTLQPQAGGAMAETFVTHHNALDHDFHLRIAPELDLKMAVAGGLERVFEFSTNFRNEGMDSSHLQEFVMLEWYAAYEDFESGMRWSEELIQSAVKETLGTSIVTLNDKDGNQYEIDFSKSFPQKKFGELLKEEGVDINASREELVKIATENGIPKEDAEKRSHGNLLDDIYKKLVRPKLIEPIFVTHHPIDLKPLARRSLDNPNLAESYQLVIASWEIINAYSELVDPVLQREALEAQAKAKKAGDREAMEVNEEFLTAMEHGMPPMTGWGMGIDRFVALITGQKNLRDIVLFPLMKPENKD